VLTVGAALALGVAWSGGAALAQDSAAKPAAGAPTVPVIIVIDPDRVVRESAAGKSVAVEADKYGKGFEEDSRKEEAGLQASAQEVQKQQASLTREQVDQKRGELEQRAAEIRRNELKRRQAFERSYNAAMDQVQQAMIDATREVALARRADVVLVRQALMFFNGQFDVTGEVIDLMNKRITKIDFPPPKIEADVPGAAGAPGAAQPQASDQTKVKPKPKDKLQPQPQTQTAPQLQLNLQPQQQQ